MVSTGDPHIDKTSLQFSHILTFHRVSSHFTWGATNFSPRRLLNLMQFLKEQGFVFFSSNQNGGEKAIRISFDDGYEELLDIIPNLVEVCGGAPIIFIPTSFIGQYNSWDYSYYLSKTKHLNRNQIQSLSDRGVYFGSHGHSHCDLTQLDQKKLTSELSDSQKILQDITGQPITELSYPFGKVDKTVMQSAIESGYSTGYTMKFPQKTDNNFHHGRIAIYGFDTNLSVLRKLREGPFRKFEIFKARTMNACSAGTTVFQKTSGIFKKNR